MSRKPRHLKPIVYSSGTPPATPEQADAVTSTILGVDAVAREAEGRWGIGRLQLLVSDATRVRFRHASDLWRASLLTWEPAQVARTGLMMKRAWASIEAEATAAGHQPTPAEAWETLLPDGSVLVVARTPEDARRFADAAGRQVEVVSLEEVARIYARYRDDVTAVITAFPGARIVEPSTVYPPGYSTDWARGEAQETLDALYDVGDAA